MLERQQALRDQIPPSAAAGPLHMTGPSPRSPDPRGPKAPDGPAEAAVTRAGEDRATAARADGAPEGDAQGGDAREGGAPEGDAQGGDAREGDAGGGAAAGGAPDSVTGSVQDSAPGSVQGSVQERQTRPAEPSWARVIATTVRLWVRRRRERERATAARSALLLGVVILAIALVVAVGLMVALPRHPTAAAPSPTRPGTSSGQGTTGLGAVANIRRKAATWVAQQVSASAIVACDPVMCAALQARGVAAPNLLILQSGADDPLGSDIVLATAAVRSQFGSRLASVYAPTVIASFGSGEAQIDVRAVAPDGTAAYQAALGSDRLARRTAGAQLLRNPRITAAPAAGRAVTTGQVDSRLLITLAALAARYPLNIVAFGAPASGASPDVPVRSVDIKGTGTNGAVELAPVRAFLQAQVPPYRPMRTQVQRAGGAAVVRIDLSAPSPLGLLGAPA